MPLTIYDMEEGNNGWVLDFADEMIASRVLSMGMLPGSAVTIIRRAPFSGGIYIKVDGTNMVMRCSEAKRILLATEDPALSFGAKTSTPAAG